MAVKLHLWGDFSRWICVTGWSNFVKVQSSPLHRTLKADLSRFLTLIENTAYTSVGFVAQAGHLSRTCARDHGRWGVRVAVSVTVTGLLGAHPSASCGPSLCLHFPSRHSLLLSKHQESSHSFMLLPECHGGSGPVFHYCACALTRVVFCPQKRRRPLVTSSSEDQAGFSSGKPGGWRKEQASKGSRSTGQRSGKEQEETVFFSKASFTQKTAVIFVPQVFNVHQFLRVIKIVWIIKNYLI